MKSTVVVIWFHQRSIAAVEEFAIAWLLYGLAAFVAARGLMVILDDSITAVDDVFLKMHGWGSGVREHQSVQLNSSDVQAVAAIQSQRMSGVSAAH